MANCPCVGLPVEAPPRSIGRSDNCSVVQRMLGLAHRHHEYYYVYRLAPSPTHGVTPGFPTRSVFASVLLLHAHLGRELAAY